MATVASKPRNYTMKDLKNLGHQLLTSKAHTNNAPILISFLSSSPRPPLQHALEALLTLQSFFTPLLPRIPSSSSSIKEASESLKRRDESEVAESIYKDWLKIKFDDFISVLIDLTISSQSEEEEEQSLRDLALEALMEFVKQGRGGRFQSGIYYRFLRTVVYSPFSVDLLLDLLASKYFKYIDLRYLTYISLEKLARSCDPGKTYGKTKDNSRDGDRHIFGSSNKEPVIYKIYGIFSRIPPLEGHESHAEHEMWSQSEGQTKEAIYKLSSKAMLLEDEFNKSGKSDDNVLSISFVTKKMKSRMSRAWLTFLRLPLPLDVYKKVLSSLHQSVIPHMANPVLLCDFLTRSYDFGGVISVMALSSLFTLMTQHGLEYPQFYDKLYALLVPTIFMAKHRAKFFELLDSCLKSTLLPAYLAAAFAKKLSRLALSAPPSGSLVIIAIIHNLLRRHPSINCLVHQDDVTNGEGSTVARVIDENVRETDAGQDMYGRKSGVDLFNSEEHDPSKANAMRSSLWEVETLRHHYCSAVSRFVMSLENDLTIRAKTTEVTVKDFSSGSYGTIFNEEGLKDKRRIKRVPLAFYRTMPTSLFSESDFPGWTFEFRQGSKDLGSENNCKSKETKVEEIHEDKSAKRQRLVCA